MGAAGKEEGEGGAAGKEEGEVGAAGKEEGEGGAAGKEEGEWGAAGSEDGGSQVRSTAPLLAVVMIEPSCFGFFPKLSDDTYPVSGDHL